MTSTVSVPFFGPLSAHCDPSTSAVVPAAIDWKSMVREFIAMSGPARALGDLGAQHRDVGCALAWRPRSRC